MEGGPLIRSWSRAGAADRSLLLLALSWKLPGPCWVRMPSETTGPRRARAGTAGTPESQVVGSLCQDHGSWRGMEAASNPTRPLPRAGGLRQRCRRHRSRASFCSRVGAYAARPHERHPCRACHFRAIHNGRERSHAYNHGQRHGRHDLRRSSSGQMATPPDLALQAGGRRFKSGGSHHQLWLPS